MPAHSSITNFQPGTFQLFVLIFLQAGSVKPDSSGTFPAERLGVINKLRLQSGIHVLQPSNRLYSVGNNC
jgi:hypothetical protein